MNDQPDQGSESGKTYQVLARKYRPGHFRDLIGQEAMVQTLTNAFAHDRIAHAFIMTGVRGVGKTTTARIIAKGLNCTRDDGPTIDPCGVCEACVSIADGRNVDVIEMDAASNTGVGDVREIIDSVRYRAAAARYKVYIIDEVHMLSTSAFNALLKTLEEPPPHVKFIFATTEIRKVPVTVLSRCQRFDLRRIEPEVMMEHLASIAAKEGASLTTEALALITRAAEGSVRDALSLLDQAVAHGTGGEIGAVEVRAMLGLADRGRVIDLFEAIMRGDAAAALTELSAQYAEGADPAVVLRDLAELTHWISVIRVTPDALEDPTIGADERARGKELAASLSMRVLTRAWQMLLKAMEELALAPNAMMAAEMAVIRLTHVSDLPTPGDLVRRLTEEGAAPGAPSRPSGGPTGNGTRAMAVVSYGDGSAAATTAPEPQPMPGPRASAGIETIEDITAILARERNLKLQKEVEDFVSLVSLRPGVIEFNPRPGAPADLAGRLGQALGSATGQRWAVAVSEAEGGETIRARKDASYLALMTSALEDPMVLAALETFGEAEILEIRPIGAAEGPVGGEFLAPMVERDDIEGDLVDSDDDDWDTGNPWDPFQEDT
ncbi:DNA polymerase III subunit gamma/tau [Rhodobacteraceae bacterium NNCM2]|nr:DNA polymerase III subunit gamma/tau [Coraliihabitans acroporae]